MKNFLESKKHMGVVGFLLLVVVMVGASAHRNRPKPILRIQERAPVLMNTASVQILSVSDEDQHPTTVTMKSVAYLSRHLEAHLRNNSQKIIKAYEVCAGDDCNGDWELYDDRSVPSGAEFTISPHYETAVSNPQKFTGQISVTAVIFADGTWEGDKTKVDDIRGESDGARSFYSEAAPILAKAVTAGGTRQSIEVAEQEIKAIGAASPSSDDTSTYDLAVARRRSVAKDSLLDHFEHIKKVIASGNVTDAEIKAALGHTAQLFSRKAQHQ